MRYSWRDKKEIWEDNFNWSAQSRLVL